MSKSVELKSIEQRGQYWHIRYGKTRIEIPGKTKGDLLEWIHQQLPESDETLVVICLAAYLKQDPQLANPTLIVGKTLTLDLGGKINSVDGIVRAE